MVIFHSYVSLPEDDWRIWDAESCCFIFFAHDEARHADFGAEVSVIIEAEEPWYAILQQGGTICIFLSEIKIFIWFSQVKTPCSHVFPMVFLWFPLGNPTSWECLANQTEPSGPPASRKRYRVSWWDHPHTVLCHHAMMVYSWAYIYIIIYMGI